MCACAARRRAALSNSISPSAIPSLYVELVLPKGAFDIFCERNGVVFMSEEEAAAVDADMEKWRYGDLRGAADE
jgi:hypothetical protein